MRSCLTTIMIFVSLSAAVSGCASRPKITDPCDVLIDIPTKPPTNAYLVRNDRLAAVGIVRNNDRFTKYQCKQKAKHGAGR